MTSPPDNQDTPPAKASLWALSPLLVFFLLYLVIWKSKNCICKYIYLLGH